MRHCHDEWVIYDPVMPWFIDATWLICTDARQHICMDAVCCSVLQCTVVFTHSWMRHDSFAWMQHNSSVWMQHIATHCNTLQHTATHSSVWMRHIATHCNTLICMDATQLVHGMAASHMTHSCEWHASRTLLRLLIYMRVLIYMRLTGVWDAAHLYEWNDWHVRHDSFICDMTHSYEWHDSITCPTWLIHMCDMTHSYVWHDSFLCVTLLIHLCDITCTTWLTDMGWLRLVGSLKL